MEERDSYCSINSLNEYIEVVKEITLKESNFFYRGQCNNYKPVPSVFRNGLMEKEDYLYHELILRCPSVFKGLSHLDTLVVMQHYGLPTRLLDVTSNPLVALYFSCQNNDTVDKCNPGYIYIYSVSDDRVAYSDSDRVLMISCLPVISNSDKSKILNNLKPNLEENSIKTISHNTYPAPIERFYHEITREAPAFKREIVPKDIVTPIIVKPIKANDRIVRQDGAFIISGLCANQEEAEEKIDELCSNTIIVEDKEKIISELDGFGISEASLFPEVDRVADYLKKQVFIKKD